MWWSGQRAYLLGSEEQMVCGQSRPFSGRQCESKRRGGDQRRKYSVAQSSKKVLENSLSSEATMPYRTT